MMGARFSAPVQTGPAGPPSILYSGYRVSLPWVKRRGCGVKYPNPPSAEVKERVKLYLNFSSGPHGLFVGEL